MEIMTTEEKIEHAKKDIRKAIQDYIAHTYEHGELDYVEDEFVDRLAEDSTYAKQGLRNLFRKSPAWNEELDALVINGNRTHDPDPEFITERLKVITVRACLKSNAEKRALIYKGIRFFSYSAHFEELYDSEYILDAVKEIAPNAYKPGKKMSRVCKAWCQALGVADETAGSKFQKEFAKVADEMNGRKIPFKLFVSLNPAHFLTMSNPKHDNRGSCLTSCHSLNSNDYEYNNGCSGYARDNTSFIVFTVDNPSVAETLNNRKTTRQIFAYQPGNGVLLQSRMYNTSGGTRGKAENSALYRDLIQREIAEAESSINLWNTYKVVEDGYGNLIKTGNGFGGYTDWEYSGFGARISIRKDVDGKRIVVGAQGLCIRCGEEISSGLCCGSCGSLSSQCEYCDESTYEELTPVFDGNGCQILVCPDCLEDHFTYCDICHEYHPNNCVSYVDGQNICNGCLEEACEKCDDCGEFHRRENMVEAYDEVGNQIYLCNDGYCTRNHTRCPECNRLVPDTWMNTVYLADGTTKEVCDDCIGNNENYVACQECGEYIEVCPDGTCPSCGAILVEKEETA